MGTFLISVVSTIIGYFILKAYGSHFNIEFESIGPIIIMFMIAFVISLLFNNVFEVSADTMLHCYVLDETINRQEGFNAQKAPEKLKNVAYDMHMHEYDNLDEQNKNLYN